MFDALKKFMGIEKKKANTITGTLDAMRGKRHIDSRPIKRRREKREERNTRRFLLRSGAFVTRYGLRCLEISGMDVLKALARRSDRVKYSRMKEHRLLQSIQKAQRPEQPKPTRRQIREYKRIMRKTDAGRAVHESLAATA